MFWLCPRAPSCSQGAPGRGQHCVHELGGFGCCQGLPSPPRALCTLSHSPCPWLQPLGRGWFWVWGRDDPGVSLRDAAGPSMAQPALGVMSCHGCSHVSQVSVLQV